MKLPTKQGVNMTHDTTTHRLAFLHSGDYDLGKAVMYSGLEIAYMYDANFGAEYVDFENIPAFDLVVADGERGTLEMAYLFIRAREPLSFVMVATRVGDLDNLRDRLADLPHRVETKGRALVGTLPGTDFVWPAGIVGE